MTSIGDMFPAITHILHSTYGEINHLQLPSKIKFQAILFNIYQKLLTEQNQSLKISVFGKDLNSKELPLPTPNPTGPPQKKNTLQSAPILCALHDVSINSTNCTWTVFPTTYFQLMFSSLISHEISPSFWFQFWFQFCLYNHRKTNEIKFSYMLYKGWYSCHKFAMIQTYLFLIT